jgi:hypothetical protein
MTDLERLEVILHRVHYNLYGTTPAPDGQVYILDVIIQELRKENVHLASERGEKPNA